MATTKATSTVIIFASLVLALAACCGGATAPSPMASPPETAAAPGPAVNPCINALYNMTGCLTFVEAGSNLTKPEKECCPQLAGLVESNPICLCQLLGNPDSVGIKIDLNKALKLPSVCGVTTPPVSTCAAVGVPVSLPPGDSPSPGVGVPPPGDSPSPGSSPNPSDGVPAPGPGGVNNSSNDAAASPSENKNNGNGGIQASSTLTFFFSLAIIIVSIFF